MYTFGLIGPLAIAACTAFELLVAVACQNCSRAIRRAIRAVLIISLANNPLRSWGLEGEPPEAVKKDFGTRDGTRASLHLIHLLVRHLLMDVVGHQVSFFLPRSGFLASGKLLEFSVPVPPVCPNSPHSAP